MIIRKIKYPLLLTIIFIIISFPVAYYTKEYIHLFFAWNIILAIIPLLISNYIYYNYQKIKTWVIVILIFIWLLFFPNSIYVVTDIIHISVKLFYTSGWVYIRDFKLWISLFHIIYAFLLGLVVGLKSLYIIHKTIRNKLNAIITHISIFFIAFLSANGVYIGRFLRFNSWDIYKPKYIIMQWYNSLDGFAIGFIILFTVYILVCYYLYFITKKGVNSEEDI